MHSCIIRGVHFFGIKLLSKSESAVKLIRHVLPFKRRNTINLFMKLFGIVK